MRARGLCVNARAEAAPFSLLSREEVLRVSNRATCCMLRRLADKVDPP
jgi:hypothetical protein